MILIYLTSLKEKKGKGRCAVSAHAYPSWTDEEVYHLDCFGKRANCENKLKALIGVLSKLPRSNEHPICVLTDDHELTWDLIHICAGDGPDFISEDLCNEFRHVAAQNGIRLSQFKAKDKGAMTASERSLLWEEVKAAGWGFAM